MRRNRPTLRAFYQSGRGRRDHRTLRLMKKKTYDRVASDERKFLRTAGGKGSVPLMFIGKEGTSFGSRLKWHVKQGGKWLRGRHRRYATVVLVDEYRSSQTCAFCYEPISRPMVKKFIRGKWRTVSSNSSSICYNRECPLYRKHASTQNRDVIAALNICLAGVSKTLFDETLAPFSRRSASAQLRTQQTQDTPNVPGASEDSFAKRT